MSKINILFITNGLGNTLFQTAFAENLSKNTNNVVIVKDYLAFPHFFTKNNLKWNFHEEDCIDYSSFSKSFNACDLLALIIIFFLSRVNRVFLISNYFSIKLFNRMYYHGYYQNIKNNLSSELIKKNCLKYISFKDDLLKNREHEIKNKFLVMHIRQGDFDKEDWLGLDFYIKAYLEIIKDVPDQIREIQIIGVANENFAKSLIKSLKNISMKNIKIKNYTNKSKIKDDFLRIWNAEYFISSNSTFSFWACWGKRKCMVIPRISQKMYFAVSDLNTFHKIIII